MMGNRAGKQARYLIDAMDGQGKGWKGREQGLQKFPPYPVSSPGGGEEFIGRRTNVREIDKHRTPWPRAKRR